VSTTDTEPDEARPRGFDRSRLRLGIVIAVIAGAIVFLLIQGLGGATTYFYNADEVAVRTDELAGKSIRVQGTVMGEPVREGDALSFRIEYHCETLAVSHRGDPPELFKPGIPVVLEGELNDAGLFESDRIIIRHTNEYRTDEADRLELAEDEACP
jgi:cytochrome c-type biogenesis protein CcmE